jgi:hypothetical protein
LDTFYLIKDHENKLDLIAELIQIYSVNIFIAARTNQPF